MTDGRLLAGRRYVISGAASGIGRAGGRMLGLEADVTDLSAVEHAVGIAADELGGLEGASPAYCASKAAVIGLTKVLAIDHAAEGIRVNASAPGRPIRPCSPARTACPS